MTVALKSICIYAEARCLHRHVYVKFIVRSSTRSIVICKVVELGEKVFRVSPPSIIVIIVMNWPARYPYINPTEHTWDILSRRIRQRQHHPENVQTLIDALV